MPRTLLEVPNREFPSLATGISPSIAPQDSGFWREGLNVIFRDHGVQRAAGWEARTAAGSVVVQLAQSVSGTSKIMWLGEKNGIVETSISPGTFPGIASTPADQVTSDGTNLDFAVWGSWLLIAGLSETDGQGIKIRNAFPDTEVGGRLEPQTFFPKGPMKEHEDDTENIQDADGNDIDFPEYGFHTAKLIRVLGAYAIAMNLDTGVNRIAWCKDGDPMQWDGRSAETTAGDLILREFNGEIIAAEPLGNGLLVLGGDKAGLLYPTNSVFVFGFQHRINGIGAVSKDAVVSLGNRCYGCSQQGIWVSDGTEYRYIDEPAMRWEIQHRVDWSRGSEVIAFHDEDSRQVIWYLPDQDGSSFGVGFDYSNNTWTEYPTQEVPTAVMPRDVFQHAFLAFGNTVGRRTQEGIPRGEVCVRTKLLDFGRQQILKRLQRINLGSRGNFSIRVGATDSASSEIDWFFEESVDNTVSELNMSDREAVYFVVEICGERQWIINSLEFIGELGGRTI